MLALAILFLTQTASAEYRAFELVLTGGDGTERVQLSSLTPAQYALYYPLPTGTKIRYRATWMCRGNTSFQKPVCPNPKP